MKKFFAFFILAALLCAALASCTLADRLLGKDSLSLADSPLALAEGYSEKRYYTAVIYGEEAYEELDLPRSVRDEDIICFIEVYGDSTGGGFVYCKSAEAAEALYAYTNRDLPHSLVIKRIGNVVFLGDKEILDDMP